MNKWSLILCLIFSNIYLQAQPPQGNRGMDRGGRPGMPPQGMDNRSEMRNGEGQLMLDSFPSIPDVTLEQRADIGMIMMNEHKDISKQMEKKRKEMKKFDTSSGTSDKEKIQKKIDKIDKKIEKRIEKSNEKIRKILSDEQYAIFIEKRKQIKFKRHFPPSHHRPEGGFRERPGGEDRRFMQENNY